MESVTISKAYLAELEAIKERYMAKASRGKDRLALVHQKEKENPESVRQRAQKYYELHRHEICQRRKEARLLKKQSPQVSSTHTA